MPTVDGVASLATFQSYSNMTPGRCLEYTWLAYKAHGATSSVTYATAMDAFHASGGLHPGDYNPPAGFPVWFGPKSGSAAGDVGISAGNGMVSAVWNTGWHTVTIGQRAAETGRPYLGWTERFMTDNAIFSATPTGVWSVTDKQAFLVSLGLDTGGIDGQFGPKSQAATKTFQGWVGITQDGDFGPITQGKADVIKSGRNSTSRPTTDIQAKVGATADGIWGNKTSLAVYRWQAANGLTADAIWGPASDNKAFPPAPPTPPTPQWPTNGTNATSRPTAEIQAFLIRKGYDLGASGADGQYGPKTSVAAAQFQSSVGLTVDGIWGPKTDEAAFGPVNPPDPNNPRNLPTYTPIYPGASFGLVAPLGDGVRGFKGNPPVAVPVIIDRFIIHHTDTPGNDQLDYFSYKNDRSSCPTWYLRTDGTAAELIPPKMKPCSTGAEWNWRSVAVEVLDVDANYTVSDAQLEWLAQAIAWLADFDGQTLDGIPVSFKIDRDHVLGHRDAVATACPGDFLYGKIPSIIARAQEIYDAKHQPPVPDTYVIPKVDMDAFLTKYETA